MLQIQLQLFLNLVVLPNQLLLLRLLNKQQVKLNYLGQKPQENVVVNGTSQLRLVG